MTPVVKLHDGEPDIDAGIVRSLLAKQFPQWAGLPLRQVPSAGTVNVLYRLGGELVVRLPRLKRWADQAHERHDLLRRLAPELPTSIPWPVAKGEPGSRYPWRWSVYRWIVGGHPTPGRGGVPLATDLAAFVAALNRLDPTGAPRAWRGRLASRDDKTRSRLGQLHGVVDVAAATRVWEQALALPEWEGSSSWIHGDLLPSNLLVDGRGRLAAVLDMEDAGWGDPACDLLPAWSVLAPQTRPAFRAAVGADDETWVRGRGWAVSIAALAIPYYLETNPAFAAVATRMAREAIADAGC